MNELSKRLRYRATLRPFVRSPREVEVVAALMAEAADALDAHDAPAGTECPTCGDRKRVPKWIVHASEPSRPGDPPIETVPCPTCSPNDPLSRGASSVVEHLHPGLGPSSPTCSPNETSEQ